ncbi:hypothetical protein [Methanoculleus sp. UBA303]|jgi:hypothetical protein|uniref:hypothetical protein n=1 Tax=Methanoculleus sp. UBA303 TaxID=1915497 RepID=UPI0025E6FB1E|nr:hypothetical protein [Methanoculleus sp. UBA303]MDD3932783.1 hypothetical protein [Methanoculleus sp.]
MADDSRHPEEQIGVVVDRVLVNYRGDPESRDRVAHVIQEWAEEHPDEWEELQIRCQRRHEALA